MDALHETLSNSTISEAELPAALKDLPLDLPDLYTRLLAEHSRLSRVTQEEQLTIIQCVIQPSRPLRLIELGSIIAVLRKDYTIEGLKEGKELIRDSCGRLLEILEDESVSVIHHSFTEFVRDQSRKPKHEDFPVLSENEAHLLITRTCLEYLNSCEPSQFMQKMNIGRPQFVNQVQRKSVASDESEAASVDASESHVVDRFDNQTIRIDFDQQKRRDIHNLRQRYPLLDYATSNLEYHMNHISKDQERLSDLLDWGFKSGKPAFDFWVVTQWECYRFSDLRSIHVAASRGWTAYLKHLLGCGCDVEARDAENCTPLLYAVSH
jgi:hypothetical protein